MVSPAPGSDQARCSVKDASLHQPQTTEPAAANNGPKRAQLSPSVVMVPLSAFSPAGRVSGHRLAEEAESSQQPGLPRPPRPRLLRILSPVLLAPSWSATSPAQPRCSGARVAGPVSGRPPRRFTCALASHAQVLLDVLAQTLQHVAGVVCRLLGLRLAGGVSATRLQPPGLSAVQGCAAHLFTSDLASVLDGRLRRHSQRQSQQTAGSGTLPGGGSQVVPSTSACNLTTRLCCCVLGTLPAGSAGGHCPGWAQSAASSQQIQTGSRRAGMCS